MHMYKVCVFITTLGGIRNSFRMEALVMKNRRTRSLYRVKVAFAGQLEEAEKALVFAESEIEAIDKYLHHRFDSICGGLEIIGHTKIAV